MFSVNCISIKLCKRTVSFQASYTCFSVTDIVKLLHCVLDFSMKYSHIQPLLFELTEKKFYFRPKCEVCFAFFVTFKVNLIIIGLAHSEIQESLVSCVCICFQSYLPVHSYLLLIFYRVLSKTSVQCHTKMYKSNCVSNTKKIT